MKWNILLKCLSDIGEYLSPRGIMRTQFTGRTRMISQEQCLDHKNTSKRTKYRLWSTEVSKRLCSDRLPSNLKVICFLCSPHQSRVKWQMTKAEIHLFTYWQWSLTAQLILPVLTWGILALCFSWQHNGMFCFNELLFVRITMVLERNLAWT